MKSFLLTVTVSSVAYSCATENIKNSESSQKNYGNDEIVFPQENPISPDFRCDIYDGGKYVAEDLRVLTLDSVDYVRTDSSGFINVVQQIYTNKVGEKYYLELMDSNFTIQKTSQEYDLAEEGVHNLLISTIGNAAFPIGLADFGSDVSISCWSDLFTSSDLHYGDNKSLIVLEYARRLAEKASFKNSSEK